MQSQSQVAPFQEFETTSFIIRTTELDDCDRFITRLEATTGYKTQENSLNLLYNYPNLISLVEKSYLSISILDAQGEIVGISVFNDFPQGLRGMIDFQHENFWEYWLFEAFKLENVKKVRVTCYNSLWMIYYGVERGFLSDNEKEYENLMARVFQHVYGSLQNIECILFLYRGEAVTNESTKQVKTRIYIFIEYFL